MISLKHHCSFNCLASIQRFSNLPELVSNTLYPATLPDQLSLTWSQMGVSPFNKVRFLILFKSPISFLTLHLCPGPLTYQNTLQASLHKPLLPHFKFSNFCVHKNHPGHLLNMDIVIQGKFFYLLPTWFLDQIPLWEMLLRPDFSVNSPWTFPLSLQPSTPVAFTVSLPCSHLCDQFIII